MTVQSDFEKYQASMADWVSGLMKSKGQPLPDPEAFSKPELELFNEVFRRFTDISEAIDNLQLCITFVQARVTQKKGIRLDAYLTYHVAFYIQETYILKERLKRYATKVMRLRKRAGHKVNEKSYKKIIDTVEASLSGIVSVRDSHVHDHPFNDDSMQMLSACSFLAVQFPDDPSWLKHARTKYSRVRKTWEKRLAGNRQQLNKLLDLFFSFLQAEVFESGLVVLPNNSIQRTPTRYAGRRR